MPPLNELRNWQDTHPGTPGGSAVADFGMWGKREIPVQGRKTQRQQDYDPNEAQRTAEALASASEIAAEIPASAAFFNPVTAPAAAAYYMGQGISRGDPVEAGLAALGVPGRMIAKAAPLATMAATMSPEEAQGGGFKRIIGNLLDRAYAKDKTVLRQKVKGGMKKMGEFTAKRKGYWDPELTKQAQNMILETGESPDLMAEIMEYLSRAK